MGGGSSSKGCFQYSIWDGHGSRCYGENSFDFDNNSWSPRFERNLNDWEMDELCGLLRVINGVRPNNTLVDDWEWDLNKKGIFSSKSLYLELVRDRAIVFPHKFIWNPGILSKVALFLWTTSLIKFSL